MGQGDYETVAQIFVSEGGILAQLNGSYGNMTIPIDFSMMCSVIYNVDTYDLVDVRGILEVT